MIEVIARLAIPPAVTSILSGTVQEDRATETVDIRVLSIIEFMQKNLEKRLALKEMARLVGLSDSRFRHLFTAETGMSTRACLRKLRLGRAKLLLDEDALTIDQIALRVGWQHRSHFERRFKQLYGTTPAQYRKMRRINLLQKKVAAAASATD
jgi:transcriptional regulator GlxA family with amidase domain